MVMSRGRQARRGQAPAMARGGKGDEGSGDGVEEGKGMEWGELGKKGPRGAVNSNIAVARLWTHAIPNLAVARATQTGATANLSKARVWTRATAIANLSVALVLVARTCNTPKI